MNRRDFLKAGAASVAAAPMIMSGRALGMTQPGPNDRVRIGLIGLGGRCNGVARDTLRLDDVDIVAACDCFQPRVDAAMSALGDEHGWTPYLDYREMIEKEELDGVMVITTTHARASITCDAMIAGLDVYIEKPMSLTIAEGRHMVNVARKYDRVTQVGSQQRSIPLNLWASDLVKNGAIGRVHTVLAPNFMGPLHWDASQEQPLPEDGNEGWWDIWTNQAEFRPYHQQIHRGWGHYWAYDGGGQSFGVTGWGTHSYDQINRGLGTDYTGPVEVILDEPLEHRPNGKFEEREFGPDETGARYYRMVWGTSGDRAAVRMRYANGTELQLTEDADNAPGLGCIFIGDEGRIEINRDAISSDRPELINTDDRPAHLDIPETEPHIRNWIDCMKTRERCTADAEIGHRGTTLCYLVNIARDVGRVGETLQWDPVEEQFLNCDEGNALLSRARREGWELPS